MPASSIAQILLRLFALHWCFSGATQLGGVAISVSQTGFYAPQLVSPLLYLAAGLLLWYFSPTISRRLAGKNDGRFALEGVTLQQLYATTLLGLGLYYALGTFAQVFSWVHFFAINHSPNYGFHQDGDTPSYYALTEAALTFGAGLTLMFTANHWAARLCRKSPGLPAPGDRSTSALNTPPIVDEDSPPRR